MTEIVDITPGDLLVDHLILAETNAGSDVFTGATLKSRNLEEYLPFISVNKEPLGRALPGNHGGGVGIDYYTVEAIHKTSLVEARKIYEQARLYLFTNQFKTGTNFNITIYEYTAPEDNITYEDQHFVCRGTWKIIWTRK